MAWMPPDPTLTLTFNTAITISMIAIAMTAQAHLGRCISSLLWLGSVRFRHEELFADGAPLPCPRGMG